MLKDHQDAFGHAIYDYHLRREGFEIIERDDGYITPGIGPQQYFRDFGEWSEAEKSAMNHVQGRVLDIGCGAGRHSIYLQSLGFRVTGIDISPLAVRTCQARGLDDARLLPLTKISRVMGVYDTILMLGNNFGLTGTPPRAKWFLRKLHGLTAADGRIIAQTRDPYQTEDPDHLEYHAKNREMGRLPGQLRIRVRYKVHTTPWFQLLFLSIDEFRELLAGTGWTTAAVLPEADGMYIAILEKEPGLT